MTTISSRDFLKIVFGTVPAAAIGVYTIVTLIWLVNN